MSIVYRIEPDPGITYVVCDGTVTAGEWRAAIVAGGEYQRAGVFEHLSLRYPIFVFSFKTLPPACEWLGIDADQAERMLRPLRDQSRR